MSLDGKSVASRTTSALDEKESLRPDDSASVKAAEEDDSLSGEGSITAGSRTGSEAATQAFRAQYYHIYAPDKPTQSTGSKANGLSDPLAQSAIISDNSILLPQNTDAQPQLNVDPGAQPSPSPDNLSVHDTSFSPFYPQEPDEKLLEALETPKDRLF